MFRLDLRSRPGEGVSTTLPVSLPPYKYLRNNEGLPWVRPSDWLTLTPVADTEVCFLYAVWDGDSNFLRFAATTSSGNFTVDWGDGTSTSYASGTEVSKQFLWADYGNVTSDGYRQAIVRITGNLTGVNFNLRHSSIASVFSSSQIYEMSAQGSSITSFTLGGSSSNIYHTSLHAFSYIGTCSITNMSYMFRYCYSLQSVSFSDISAATNMSYMFDFCYSLQSVSLPDTSVATNMNSTFRNCPSLQSVSLPDTSKATDMSNMFSACYSLHSVSLPNTSAVTNMTAMFQNCQSLHSVSLPNTSAVTSMRSMFSGCYSLESVSLSNT
jgi:hypothetical protein